MIPLASPGRTISQVVRLYADSLTCFMGEVGEVEAWRDEPGNVWAINAVSYRIFILSFLNLARDHFYTLLFCKLRQTWLRIFHLGVKINQYKLYLFYYHIYWWLIISLLKPTEKVAIYARKIPSQVDVVC